MVVVAVSQCVNERVHDTASHRASDESAPPSIENEGKGDESTTPTKDGEATVGTSASMSIFRAPGEPGQGESWGGSEGKGPGMFFAHLGAVAESAAARLRGGGPPL